MKHNGYDIIKSILKEDDSSINIDPSELTSDIADKIIDTTKKIPRNSISKWTLQHTAKAIKHLINKKKESHLDDENKLKGV